MTSQYYQLEEIKVSYKPSFSVNERPKLDKSCKVAELLRVVWDEDTICLFETFKVVYLNTSLKVLGVMDIGMGGNDCTPIDAKRIFSAALLCNASRIILAHNHPSGTLYPSSADKLLTEKIINAGKLLDIQVLDHIILTADSYVSFQDEGLM